MKAIISADIHNGIPGKLKDTIWAMDMIRQYAKTHDIKHIIVAGDLFHDRQSINTEVLNAVYDQLSLAKNDKQEWYCFPGNHDQYLKNSWSINSLHILSGILNVIEGIGKFKIGSQTFHTLPFVHYESKYMEALAEVNNVAKPDDILLTHIGINKAILNVCFVLQNWSIVELESTKFFRVYVGHFHCNQQVGKSFYPGSPIPFRFDEGVVDHGFYVYDLESREHQFIKMFEICSEFSQYRPPDYLTIVDEDLPQSTALVSNNKVRIMLSKDYTADELEKLRAILKRKGANSVDWYLPKEKTISESTAQVNMTTIGSPDTLFKAWLEIDKPELDLELLSEIHQQVKQEAEERYVVQEADE
jgi:DNA repair exonuclease SbcCD nuclease subunit